MAEIKKVGVLGAGLMGHGIAQVTAQAGYDVVRARGRRRRARQGHRAGSRSSSRARSRRARARRRTPTRCAGGIKGTTDYDDLADCDLVIEAITESLPLKLEMWQEVDADRQARGDLRDEHLARWPSSTRPRRRRAPTQFLGLHYFNPAQVMKLFEVIRAVDDERRGLRGRAPVRARAGQARDADARHGRLHRQPPARARTCSTRSAPTRRASARSSEIDEAMKAGAGHPMGPLTLADFVGLDTLGAICDVHVGRVPRAPLRAAADAAQDAQRRLVRQEERDGLLRLLRRDAGPRTRACDAGRRRPRHGPRPAPRAEASATARERALAGGPQHHREKAAEQGKLPVRERARAAARRGLVRRGGAARQLGPGRARRRRRRDRHRRGRAAGRSRDGQRPDRQGRLVGAEDGREDHPHPGARARPADPDGLPRRLRGRADHRPGADVPRPPRRRADLPQRGQALRASCRRSACCSARAPPAAPTSRPSATS